ncbi:hypothetical protein V8E36_006561 [Tilletia maclaganii]
MGVLADRWCTGNYIQLLPLLARPPARAKRAGASQESIHAEGLSAIAGKKHSNPLPRLGAAFIGVCAPLHTSSSAIQSPPSNHDKVINSALRTRSTRLAFTGGHGCRAHLRSAASEHHRPARRSCVVQTCTPDPITSLRQRSRHLISSHLPLLVVISRAAPKLLISSVFAQGPIRQCATGSLCVTGRAQAWDEIPSHCAQGADTSERSEGRTRGIGGLRLGPEKGLSALVHTA